MKLARGSQQALAFLGIAVLLCGTYAWAQNLGSAPQTNVAVQGQTGSQPEGAFLNFINWVGNVIAPVGAGGAVVGAIVMAFKKTSSPSALSQVRLPTHFPEGGLQ